MKNTEDNPLLQRSARPAAGLLTRTLKSGEADLRGVLKLDPAALQAASQALTQVAAKLPCAQVAAPQKVQFRKLSKITTVQTLQQLVTALGACGADLGPQAPKGVEVDTLREQILCYLALRNQAARGLQLTNNLRALLMAFAWFLLRDATRFAQEHIEADTTPVPERELYREKLSGLLAYKESTLTASEEGRLAASDDRDAQEAERERLRREALMMDVVMAIQNDWPLDPDSLAEAARYFKDAYGAAAAPGSAAAAAAAAAPSNGRKTSR